MALTHSIYETKARFSEVIPQVREGMTIAVSCRGEHVAEIRSMPQRQKPTIDKRLTDLERGGSLVRSAITPRQAFRPVERRPGALLRFLAERNE